MPLKTLDKCKILLYTIDTVKTETDKGDREMQINKGDTIKTKYQEIHIVIAIWDNVITTNKGYVHISNVVKVF